MSLGGGNDQININKQYAITGAVDLGEGDDGFALHNTGWNGGRIDGGNGHDSLVLDNDWTRTVPFQGGTGIVAPSGLLRALPTLDLDKVGNFESLTKTGAGRYVLTGSGQFDDVTVQGGTLEIGDGHASGALANDIATAAGAVLAFNRSDTISFANVVSGAGGLEQKGRAP